MKNSSQERMLKIVEEIPYSKIIAMKKVADLAAQQKDNGCLLSGKYKAYWRKIGNDAQIFAIIMKDQDLSDYP